MLPNLGPGEIAILLIIGLLVFGPKKLPEIGKNLGNAFREFTRAKNDFMDSLQGEPDRTSYSSSYQSDYSSDHYNSNSYDSDTGSYHTVSAPEGTVALGSGEIPEDDADALPYGSEFHAVDSDASSARTTGGELASAGAHHS